MGEVQRPVEKGDLAIGNLEARNQALVAKWLWRYLREQESLWAKVIKSLHGPTTDDKAASRSTYRCPWKFIASIIPSFNNHTHLRIGDGRRIIFWEDEWYGNGSFATRFPSLYRLSNSHFHPIAHFIMDTNSQPSHQISWSFHLVRNLSNREVNDMTSLLSI